jgi:hypothetical protein
MVQFQYRFFGQKLPDSERIMSKGIVMMQDPASGQSSDLLRRTASRNFANISKQQCWFTVQPITHFSAGTKTHACVTLPLLRYYRLICFTNTQDATTDTS